jgi:hypothetical protein
LNNEIDRWNSFLFNLLSIAYESGSVIKIRENLESGTVESVNFALEMIDIVVDESIKPKLVPLLDVISDEDKVKALYQFFPGEIHEYGRLVEDIINRDYNLLGVWIRACAVRNMNEIENRNTGESLVALLFSPQKLLQEESAALLARSDRDLYRSVSARISPIVKERLNSIISGDVPDGERLYEKVKFLSECFPGLSEEDLLIPAESLIYVREVLTADLNIPGGYILWKVKAGKPGKDVRITSGILNTREAKSLVGDCDFLYLLPLNSVKEYNFRFPEKSDEIMEYIEIYET